MANTTTNQKGFRPLGDDELQKVSGGLDEIVVNEKRPDDPWVTSIPGEDIYLYPELFQDPNNDENPPSYGGGDNNRPIEFETEDDKIKIKIVPFKDGKGEITLDKETLDLKKINFDLKFSDNVSFKGFVDFSKPNANGGFDFKDRNGSPTGMEAFKTPQGTGFLITITRKF
jgi:hypothetical protein